MHLEHWPSDFWRKGDFDGNEIDLSICRFVYVIGGGVRRKKRRITPADGLKNGKIAPAVYCLVATHLTLY